MTKIFLLRNTLLLRQINNTNDQINFIQSGLMPFLLLDKIQQISGRLLKKEIDFIYYFRKRKKEKKIGKTNLYDSQSLNNEIKE